MANKDDWATKLAKQWIDSIRTGKPLQQEDSVVSAKINIDWNDDSLKEYFNKFWFKFSCCHDFNGFIVANNFWLQNKRVHGTFHDFMRLLEGFDFDRDQLQI